MKTLILVFSLCLVSFAEVQLSVTGAGVRRARIAVGEMNALAGATADPGLASQLRSQLLSDLELINLFEFLPDSQVATVDRSQDFSSMNYSKWQELSATFALRTGYRHSGDKITLEAILYDIPGQKKLFGNRYQYAASNWPRLVHTLSEDVLKALTGERGLFNSRILMVCSDLRKRRSPPKEIYVVDADGRNAIQLTADNSLSLSPAWMNDGQHISYTQFDFVVSRGVRKRGTVLKKHNLSNGSRTILSSRDGLNSGASWSPNGKRGVITLSFTGRPELYLINPDGSGEPEPLSRNIKWKSLAGTGFQPSNVSLLFDVEPHWAPDGNQITFSSARTGNPMIYVVDLASQIAQQLTFAGKYNASPAWSPKGDMLLFAAQRTGEGNFDIYAIKPDGNNLDRITVGDRPGRKINHESPSWAPTGRHFAVGSNESGNYGVYVISADGMIKRKISPENRECNSPDWGSAE